MKPRIFYGWWIVLSTNLICMLGYGTWLYSFGVFFKPMMAEFGWTRALTAGAFSLRSIEGGIAAPVVGWAVDKYGGRVLIAIGAVISGAGFALMYFVHTLLGFYLIYGVLLSAGMSAMLYLPANTVIAKWFVRKHSRAVSILTVGAGIGGLICAPASAVLISHVGWRWAFVTIGLVVWAVALPLALGVIRNRPEDKGLLPDGDPPGDTRTGRPGAASLDGTAPELQGQADYTLRQALGSSTFWILVSAFFFQNMAHSVVVVHAVPHLTDVGISMEKAAFSLGLLTAVSIIGRLSFGYLGDFVDKRYLFMLAYVLEASGMLVLMQARTMPLVYLFIFLFGVGFGGAVPLAPAIRAQYFGRAAFGKIYGFMTPFTMASSAVGPILAGHIFDVTGSYNRIFILTASLALVAALIMYFAKPKYHSQWEPHQNIHSITPKEARWR